jgi:hypothetical protein
MRVNNGIDYVILGKGVLWIDLGKLYDNYDKAYYSKEYFLQVKNYSFGELELSKFLNKVRRRD